MLKKTAQASKVASPKRVFEVIQNVIVNIYSYIHSHSKVSSCIFTQSFDRMYSQCVVPLFWAGDSIWPDLNIVADKKRFYTILLILWLQIVVLLFSIA